MNSKDTIPSISDKDVEVHVSTDQSGTTPTLNPFRLKSLRSFQRKVRFYVTCKKFSSGSHPKENVALSRFQKNYQKTRLLNFMVRFKKMFRDTRNIALKKPSLPRTESRFITVHGEQFDKLENHINNKVVQKISFVLLKRVYRYLNTTMPEATNMEEMFNRIVAVQISPKDFLCSFMFMGFPEFLLLKSPSELNKDKSTVQFAIFDLSRRMIGSWGLVMDVQDKIESTLKNLNKDDLSDEDRIENEKLLHNFKYAQKEMLRKFIKNLNMYSNCYAAFKEGDRVQKIQEAVQRWYYLEKNRNMVLTSKRYSEEQKKSSIAVFEKDQKNLCDMIKKIDPKFDFKYLDKYKTLIDKIEFNMEKSFWDSLEEDIKSDKCEMFSKMIKEIHDELVSLFPHKNPTAGKKESEKVPLDKLREDFFKKFNRDKMEEEFKDKFDVDFIRQMAQNKAYTNEQFIGLANYILSIVKELQAPARTPLMLEEWKELLGKIEDGTYDTREKQGVQIVKFLLEEINNIKDHIIATHTMMQLGINPLTQ